jgi:hypothetical protein
VKYDSHRETVLCNLTYIWLSKEVISRGQGEKEQGEEMGKG